MANGGIHSVIHYIILAAAGHVAAPTFAVQSGEEMQPEGRSERRSRAAGMVSSPNLLGQDESRQASLAAYISSNTAGLRLRPPMPSVPSTLSPSASTDPVFLPPVLDDSYGPTPDPDLDDLELVSVENGNAVTEVRLALLASACAAAHPLQIREPPHVHTHVPLMHPPRPRAPHMSLSHLVLHSPSPFVGTPFDLSPRFEYPFPPAAASAPDVSLPAPPFPPFCVSASLSALSPASRAALSPASMRSHAHPKLPNSQPPVPPGLALKRRSVPAQAARPPLTRPRSSSHGRLPPAPEPDIARALDDLQRVRDIEAVQRARDIKAVLQRRFSDETVVDDEPESEREGEDKVAKEVVAEAGVPGAFLRAEGANVTFLGRTLRAVSDASVTDVDPTEAPGQLDGTPSRPRSRTASPTPSQPRSGTTSPARSRPRSGVASPVSTGSASLP
ncbi:hypothetical protein OBBRIDRAFT_883925 [Obba rivulosa]|uniref:Uncharacterized protein n=1 Tax=Obba rivulosa TaxID=1052685 RepID=A0A8E2DTI0_9APHY|nr:hypothetical protein OBBRIDRAFT_883925 [Obba rivulosa]